MRAKLFRFAKATDITRLFILPRRPEAIRVSLAVLKLVLVQPVLVVIEFYITGISDKGGLWRRTCKIIWREKRLAGIAFESSRRPPQLFDGSRGAKVKLKA